MSTSCARTPGCAETCCGPRLQGSTAYLLALCRVVSAPLYVHFDLELNSWGVHHVGTAHEVCESSHFKGRGASMYWFYLYHSASIRMQCAQPCWSPLNSPHAESTRVGSSVTPTMSPSEQEQQNPPLYGTRTPSFSTNPHAPSCSLQGLRAENSPFVLRVRSTSYGRLLKSCTVMRGHARSACTSLERTR